MYAYDGVDTLNEKFLYQERKQGYLARNKPVTVAVVISFILLVFVIFLEKSKAWLTFIPKMRGEVNIDSEFVITRIKNRFPLVIRKHDPFISNQLRFSGHLNSHFSKVADMLCNSGDTVAEVGACFGYNTIPIADKLRNNGKFYAYEANKSICNNLKKSIALNDLEDVVVLKHLALTSSDGQCSIDDYMSLSLEQTKASQTIQCKCSTIDKEFPNGKKLTRLLVDIPEYGLDILKGAKELIENSSDLKIVFAFDYETLSKRYNVENEFKNLAAKGMRFYTVNKFAEYNPIHINEMRSLRNTVIVISREPLN